MERKRYGKLYGQAATGNARASGTNLAKSAESTCQS